jgi:hypothetical protein
MQTKTQGFEITDVPGVEKITIRPSGDNVEAVVEFEFIGHPGVAFDLAHFRDFVDALNVAERLASSLDIQVQSARREA